MDTNLDNAISKLSKEQLENPIFICKDSPFIGSTIFFYNKGKFYEGKTKTVQEVIKSRAEGEPTKSEINEAVKRIKKNNKGILFCIRARHYYGNHIIEAQKITSKTIADKEFLQIKVDVRFGDN